ncbi:MAG: hypothetical protein JWO91_139 [Acidobacteriaceae bacterium]|nr:hypothetical protein [Acidobacteriaceae bacterium]
MPDKPQSSTTPLFALLEMAFYARGIEPGRLGSRSRSSTTPLLKPQLNVVRRLANRLSIRIIVSLKSMGDGASWTSVR